MIFIVVYIFGLSIFYLAAKHLVSIVDLSDEDSRRLNLIVLLWPIALVYYMAVLSKYE